MHILTNNVIFKFLLNTFRDYRKNRDLNNTIVELSKLSDRELADIGIHRGMIRSVAAESLQNA